VQRLPTTQQNTNTLSGDCHTSFAAIKIHNEGMLFARTQFTRHPKLKKKASPSDNRGEQTQAYLLLDSFASLPSVKMQLSQCKSLVRVSQLTTAETKIQMLTSNTRHLQRLIPLEQQKRNYRFPLPNPRSCETHNGRSCNVTPHSNPSTACMFVYCHTAGTGNETNGSLVKGVLPIAKYCLFQ